MLHIDIRKVGYSGMKCDNYHCSHDPELFDKVINTHFMKEGTIYARIFLASGNVDYYCRNCIDQVYQNIKSKLDTKLWVFQ